MAAALWEAGGTVETVQVEVPGLWLAPGLTEWRVPSTNQEAKEEGGAHVSFGSWGEVPESDKCEHMRLHRSMFPPAAYAAPAAAADALGAQLKRCARLLPARDDGGCFFLAILRHVQGGRKLKRGDRVLVKSQGKEAVVREPKATGKFAGLVRVQYDEDSGSHDLVPSPGPLRLVALLN